MGVAGEPLIANSFPYPRAEQRPRRNFLKAVPDLEIEVAERLKRERRSTGDLSSASVEENGRKVLREPVSVAFS